MRMEWSEDILLGKVEKEEGTGCDNIISNGATAPRNVLVNKGEHKQNCMVKALTYYMRRGSKSLLMRLKRELSVPVSPIK